MNEDPEDVERDFEQLAEGYAREIRAEIDEAAVLVMCFPGSETGNDALIRVRKVAKENPQIFWQWISEKFPRQKVYWQGGLDTATGSTQSESEDAE
jgi:hypothetical protein